MILFATDIDSFHQLAQTEYIKLIPEQNEQRRAKQAIIDARNADYQSMLPIWSKISERHVVMARMNDHARFDPDYFWSNINK